MKLKEEVIIAPSNDEWIMADASGAFKGMVKLNETAAFIANLFVNDISVKEAIEKVMNEYEVNEDDAKNAVLYTIERIKEAGLFCNE